MSDKFVGIKLSNLSKLKTKLNYNWDHITRRVTAGHAIYGLWSVNLVPCHYRLLRLEVAQILILNTLEVITLNLL